VLKAAVAANLALACILASPLEARPTVQGLWLTDANGVHSIYLSISPLETRSIIYSENMTRRYQENNQENSVIT
jgi:hypothetical protein